MKKIRIFVLYEHITLSFEHLNQSNTTTLDQSNYLGDYWETCLKSDYLCISVW